jgi:hypothetical protein
MTSTSPQNTDFSRDILGRYTCNGLDEALQSTDTSVRPMQSLSTSSLSVAGRSPGCSHSIFSQQMPLIVTECSFLRPGGWLSLSTSRIFRF